MIARTGKILAAGAALLLASCIDSREELWLFEDGSGRAHVDVSLPSSVVTLHGGTDAVLRTFDEQMAGMPSVTVDDRRLETDKDRAKLTVDLRFSSLADLTAESTEKPKKKSIPAIRHWLGSAEVKTGWNSATFERRVDAARALPTSLFFRPGKEDFRRVTILHLPIAAAEHNATSVKDGGRTLVWDTPLSLALRGPLIQRVVVKRTPVPIVLGAIALPVAAILTGWIILRRRRTAAPE